MEIKKAILEKVEYGKLDISQKSYWVDLRHQGKDDLSMIIGMCTVEEGKENKCYTANIELFDKDQTFTYPDGKTYTTTGYKNSKNVMKMLQKKCKLYPAMSGAVLERDKNGVVIKIELLGVAICDSNVDATIPPLELKETL